MPVPLHIQEAHLQGGEMRCSRGWGGGEEGTGQQRGSSAEGSLVGRRRDGEHVDSVLLAGLPSAAPQTVPRRPAPGNPSWRLHRC